jgi:hypothetical protein
VSVTGQVDPSCCPQRPCQVHKHVTSGYGDPKEVKSAVSNSLGGHEPGVLNVGAAEANLRSPANAREDLDTGSAQLRALSTVPPSSAYVGKAPALFLCPPSASTANDRPKRGLGSYFATASAVRTPKHQSHRLPCTIHRPSPSDKTLLRGATCRSIKVHDETARQLGEQLPQSRACIT